jgi:hypothetical protein
VLYDFLMNGSPRRGMEGAHGQVAGFCECGNGPSGFIKYGKFLE